MWQWRCGGGGGGDGKRLHYRISRASAATAAALHSTTVTNQRENAGTQFSPVPILHPIIQ